MAYQPPFERNDRIDSLCMEIAELVGALAPETPLAKSPALHRKLRIKTIHSSLLIEGNGLDEGLVTAILDGKRVLGDSRDILEVENAKRAYDLISAIRFRTETAERVGSGILSFSPDGDPFWHGFPSRARSGSARLTTMPFSPSPMWSVRVRYSSSSCSRLLETRFSRSRSQSTNAMP